MRVFVDANVILDVLAKREPFYEQSAKVLSLWMNGTVSLYTSALIIATVYYILSTFSSKEEAHRQIQKLRAFIKVLPVGQEEIDLALESELKDFEDAIQVYCAARANIDLLVTRNGKDFKGSRVRVVSPGELLSAVDEMS